VGVAVYRELSPPPALRGHLACLWVQVTDGVAARHDVVPDACSDIISIDGAPPVVVGPATRTVTVELPPRTIIVGARFRPGGAAAALGVAMDELVDRDVALSEMWRSTTELADGVAGGGLADRLAALERELTRRLAGRAVDRFARVAVDWLAGNPGRHVSALAGDVGLGDRQLRRRIASATGYAPKLLHRILRFQRLLVGMHRGRDSLAMLAAGAGYLDQSHMTREVHELAGMTPRSLLARAIAPTAMSEFFRAIDAD
jgi:AraC-like DNA-binding protein